MLSEARLIPELPFGGIGQDSTRTIFRAAALGRLSQEKADAVRRVLAVPPLSSCNPVTRDPPRHHNSHIGSLHDR
jgi:hypothetical protein